MLTSNRIGCRRMCGESAANVFHRVIGSADRAVGARDWRFGIGVAKNIIILMKELRSSSI
jgi:hypothetical protein